MRLSHNQRNRMYAAIHTEIVDVRIVLRLNPKDDVRLAQVETKLWDRLKKELNIND